MSGLTRLAGDNDNGVAHDINNTGEIVGISSNGTVSRPTKWTHNGTAYVPSDLGTVAGTASSTGRAWANNQNGIATGLSTNMAGTSQATLWNGGTINSSSWRLNGEAHPQPSHFRPSIAGDSASKCGSKSLVRERVPALI